MEKGWNRLTDKDGAVYFKRTGKPEKFYVPSEAVCREQLIQLLESVDGDTRHDAVTRFWNERSNALRDTDHMKAARAAFIYDRLVVEWDLLTNVPEPDIFGAFAPKDEWKPEPLTPEEESWFDRQPESPKLTFNDFKEKALKVLNGKAIQAQQKVESGVPRNELACPHCGSDCCYHCWECGNECYDHKPTCSYEGKVAQPDFKQEEDIFTAFNRG